MCIFFNIQFVSRAAGDHNVTIPIASFLIPICIVFKIQFVSRAVGDHNVTIPYEVLEESSSNVSSSSKSTQDSEFIFLVDILAGFNSSSFCIVNRNVSSSSKSTQDNEFIV